MKIIIVDNNKAFREGLKFFLEKNLGHSIIAEPENGKEFLELSNIHQADIVLMDIEMPEMNGLIASKKILNRYFNLKIIAISMYKDKAYLKDLLECGIKGFVSKSETFANIEDTINMVCKNELCFPDDLMLIKRE